MFTNGNLTIGNFENVTRIVDLDQRQKKLEEEIDNIKIRRTVKDLWNYIALRIRGTVGITYDTETKVDHENLS